MNRFGNSSARQTSVSNDRRSRTSNNNSNHSHNNSMSFVSDQSVHSSNNGQASIAAGEPSLEVFKVELDTAKVDDLDPELDQPILSP